MLHELSDAFANDTLSITARTANCCLDSLPARILHEERRGAALLVQYPG